MGDTRFEFRRKVLLTRIDRLSENAAKAALGMMIESIVTDTAGNLDNPYAYMWQQDYRAIERAIIEEAGDVR